MGYHGVAGGILRNQLLWFILESVFFLLSDGKMNMAWNPKKIDIRRVLHGDGSPYFEYKYKTM